MSEYSIRYVDLPRERPELGRLVAHDDRSRAFALPEPRKALRSVKHKRGCPVLNQGKVGACTCFAGLGALGTGAFYTPALRSALATAGFDFNDASGIELYKRVTKIDEFRGAYPPDDTGSSGNAVGKLFTSLKLISGWKHALSIDAALNELQERPVITGVNWYGGFDQPDDKGFINLSGRVVGGHEFVVDEINVEEEWVGCTNSWGTRYGKLGTFKLRWSLWDRLLKERGDVTAFVPLTEPAPTPTPVPVPEPPKDELAKAEADMAAAVAKWLKLKGYKI